MRTAKNQGERGVALLMAIFALVLLSAIALGMMYSANTETKINANFRDKQTAVYASQSGALEARARLQPKNGDLGQQVVNGTLLSDIPKTNAPNVLYILNPGSDESASSIQPWDYKSSYPDTELCQENALGLSGTAGVPCSGSSSLPSGSAWYTTASAATPSQLGGSPLAYKWTRVSLKTDNMTPVFSAGTPAADRQVCFDGLNQYVLPSGASTNCSGAGKVTAVTVTNWGSGYTSNPTVTLTGGGGTGATATAQLNSSGTGTVTSITLTNHGSNYTQPPIVTLLNAPGDLGIGATAYATITAPGAGPVNSVSLSSTGNPTGCYLTAPTVSFSGGGGSGATATATLSSTTECIYSWSITGSCSKEKGNTDTVGTSGGGGSGFAGTITFQASGSGAGNVSAYAITNPGNGYTSAPANSSFVVYNNGSAVNNCNLLITPTMGHTVASLTLTNGGSGYTSNPTVKIASSPVAPGGAATATATISGGGGGGQVSGVYLSNAGGGYTIAPTVVFTNAPGDTTGSGAAAIAKLTPGMSITVTSGGSGYTSAPTCNITGGGGSGATCVATFGGGAYNGQVFLITSFAQTISGSRAMTQMEVASPPRAFNLPGALTLDGPVTSGSTLYAVPNSQNFTVSGVDHSSTAETVGGQACGPPVPPKVAVGVYDDPANPTSPTAVDQVTDNIDAASRQANYVGGPNAPTPDVVDVYQALGDQMTTPWGVNALASAVEQQADTLHPSGCDTTGSCTGYTYGTDLTSSTSNVALGTAANPVVDVVHGNLTLSGNATGYGILLVTGTLNMSGNFSWNGLILVIGQGVMNLNGGGNGGILGAVLVAKSNDGTASAGYPDGHQLPGPDLGSPSVNWNGGGTNGVRYDSCWVNKMENMVPFNPPPSTAPLRILSTRTVTY